MATYFMHPSRAGHVEQAGGIRAYWLTFFFGPFYLLAKRAYAAAVLYAATEALGVMLIVLGASAFPQGRRGVMMVLFVLWNCVGAAAFYDMTAAAYRKRGWRQVAGLPPR
jgi:hypothetical protein